MLVGVRDCKAWWQQDKMQEECGVFGIYAPGVDVVQLTYYGLYALQHRGQESAGIAATNGRNIDLLKGTGLVSEVFSKEKLKALSGHAAIGHVRYAGIGPIDVTNAQPLVFQHRQGVIGIAHNGSLANVGNIREMLFNNGVVFQTSTDSEVIANLIARYHQNSIEEAVMKAMIDLKGAYSLVVLTEDTLYAVRDPYGFRPLCLGRLDGGWVVASESCALDTVGAEFVRDVKPGEIVRLDKDGLTSLQTLAAPRPAHCIFEYVYFARPDSTVDGYNVNKVRREMGRQLAREYQVDADIVIPVPDSGIAAARGYAEESGIPYEEGLMKNRYIGRTFIQPTQDRRDLGVRLKLNPVREVIAGKKIVLIDDSLVRGTTSKKIVKMLRQCGVAEVHLCLSSPPVIAGCHYGIDTKGGKLVAADKSLEEIKNMVGVDGLHYLSIEGLIKVFGENAPGFCTACFDNKYPVEVLC